MNINNLGPINTTSLVEDKIALIDQELLKASQNEDRSVKKEHYEKVFQVFKSLAVNGQLPPELASKFYLFLETFGDKVCYAQMGPKGKDEGFCKSARLMEFSFLLQMKQKVNFNWSQVESLDLLIDQIERENEQEVVEDYLMTINSAVLVESVTDKPTLLITLKHLAYSYQNVEALNKDKYPLHLKLNTLVEQLIDRETSKGRLEFAEFKYNRCGFLIGLEKHSPEETIRKKIEAYDEVLALFESECVLDPSQNRALKAKISQINNMKGIILVPVNPALSEDSFRLAFRLRNELFQEGIDPQDEYFLSNIRTGIIHCLSLPPLTQERVLEANQHAQALGAYVQKLQASNNQHLYQTSYANAIVKAATALKSFTKPQ